MKLSQIRSSMETDWLVYGNTGSEDVDIKHEPLEPDADYYVSLSSSECILTSGLSVVHNAVANVYNKN